MKGQFNNNAAIAKIIMEETRAENQFKYFG
jgi:hypothetical protein